jgi:hypothetical protein
VPRTNNPEQVTSDRLPRDMSRVPSEWQSRCPWATALDQERSVITGPYRTWSCNSAWNSQREATMKSTTTAFATGNKVGRTGGRLTFWQWQQTGSWHAQLSNLSHEVDACKFTWPTTLTKQWITKPYRGPFSNLNVFCSLLIGERSVCKGCLEKLGYALSRKFSHDRYKWLKKLTTFLFR